MLMLTEQLEERERTILVLRFGLNENDRKHWRKSPKPSEEHENESAKSKTKPQDKLRSLTEEDGIIETVRKKPMTTRPRREPGNEAASASACEN